MLSSAAPTFGSLFAGVGGFDLGFERAGMRSLWQVEIDNAARAVLARRFPDAAQYADVREVGAHNLAPVDVICGGFPCQDLSVAGKRAGIVDGARSSLFYEMVRITNELRPAFLVWENVPGLFSSDYGRDFARVLAALAVIGYSGAWTVFDSRYFGLAQRRRRVFGVFARGDIGAGPCAEILSLAARLRWNTAAGEEARENVAATLSRSAGHHGRSSPRGDGSDNLVARCQTARALTARNERYDGGTETFVSGTLSANRGGLDRPAGNANELDFCIAAPVVIQTANTSALPLNAQNGGMGAPGVRRLTPVECERLQGFPDGWTDGQSDSARYRQMGNAVSVPVAEWIGRRLVSVAERHYVD